MIPSPEMNPKLDRKWSPTSSELQVIPLEIEE